MDYSYSSAGRQPFFSGFHHPAQDHAVAQVDDYVLNSNAAPYDSSFVPFQQGLHYDAANFLVPPPELPPQTQQGSASPELSRHDSRSSVPSRGDIPKPPASVAEVAPALAPDESGVTPGNRSSSEEKDTLTPQQSRRKAQNRAAQRAFRERKEKHVKELEAQLNSLQHQSAKVTGENERLRREIAKIATENKILRETSRSFSGGRTPLAAGAEADELVGPLSYTPTDPRPVPGPGKTSSSSSSSSTTTHRDADYRHGHFVSLKTVAVDDETGEPLLGTGPTWDYIQAHPLVKQGLVDVGDVSERLKKLARCNGQGPVFKESDILRAIDESAVAGGRDELL